MPKFSGIVGRMETGMDWDRLGRYVREARGARSQKDIAENNGPSDETISKIERGKYRPTRSVQETLDKLDAGLGWPPGTAHRVLQGKEPVTDFPASDPPEGLQQDMTDQMRLLLELALDADLLDAAAAQLDKSEYEPILVHIDRLTQRVNDAVLSAIGSRRAVAALKTDRLNRRRMERLGEAPTAEHDLLDQLIAAMRERHGTDADQLLASLTKEEQNAVETAQAARAQTEAQAKEVLDDSLQRRPNLHFRPGAGKEARENPS